MDITYRPARETGFEPAVHIVADAGRPVAYAGITGGHISPVAIDPAADAERAVNAVVRDALADNPASVDLMVPGNADAVLGALSSAGLSIM